MTKVPSNFHTHTYFSDGKNTPEEMIHQAILLGCPALGFSDHGYTSIDSSYCLTLEGTREYCRQIRDLKESYRGRIEIFLGTERDYFGDEPPTEEYDYIIGSVHYLRSGSEYLPVDYTAETLEMIRDRFFHGDVYAMTEAYYEQVSEIYERTHCDIIGHFDLITKFQEQKHLFDESHPRYIAAVNKALDRLLPTGCIFEVNTGAISRGVRTTPYPADFILNRLHEAGASIIYSSDCHDKINLLFDLPKTDEALRGVQILIDRMKAEK